jgi:hypothetical protein
MPMGTKWEHVATKPSRRYVCGYCGGNIVSEIGYRGVIDGVRDIWIYICHSCGKPTFFDENARPTPGSLFGNRVADTEVTVDALYEEARRAYSVGSFTAVVLCCRKLLMHVAVSKGANVGESFVFYVKYLADNNFVPPGAKPWVDHIRTKGNEANHDITIMKAGDATELLEFSEMLLKLIYEYPAAVARKYPPKG